MNVNCGLRFSLEQNLADKYVTHRAHTFLLVTIFHSTLGYDVTELPYCRNLRFCDIINFMHDN